MAETEQQLNCYADFYEKVLAIPVVKGRKTEKEKFAGAEATYTVECMMKDHKALQGATSHLSASFPRSVAFLRAQIPESLRRRMDSLGRDLKGSFGGLLRTQLILMGMTFLELLLAFWLLRVKGAVGLAAMTAAVDALPVFGTGTVLLPWAFRF